MGRSAPAALATAALDPQLGAALLTCVAVLALKMGLLHALTGEATYMPTPLHLAFWCDTALTCYPCPHRSARARFATENFMHVQDKAHLLAPLLKPLALAYKGLAIGDVYVFDKLEKNNAENEPFFILLMLVAGLMKAVPGELGATICTVYTYSRVLHSLTFVAMPYTGPELRTLSYLPGLVCILFTAGYVLNGAASSAKGEL